MTITNASKIHVSKSNPNLINNELQPIANGSANGSPNVQNSSINKKYLTIIIIIIIKIIKLII